MPGNKKRVKKHLALGTLLGVISRRCLVLVAGQFIKEQ